MQPPTKSTQGWVLGTVYRIQPHSPTSQPWLWDRTSRLHSGSVLSAKRHFGRAENYWDHLVSSLSLFLFSPRHSLLTSLKFSSLRFRNRGISHHGITPFPLSNLCLWWVKSTFGNIANESLSRVKWYLAFPVHICCKYTGTHDELYHIKKWNVTLKFLDSESDFGASCLCRLSKGVHRTWLIISQIAQWGFPGISQEVSLWVLLNGSSLNPW